MSPFAARYMPYAISSATRPHEIRLAFYSFLAHMAGLI